MQAWEEKIIERQEAREEGLAEGIKITVELLKELGMSEDKIRDKSAEKFHFTVEEAEKYMKDSSV